MISLLKEPEYRTRYRVRRELRGRETTAVVNALSVDSPDEIDVIVDRAVRAGGTEGDAQDYGFLRSRCFRDPDGHQWEILWVDPAAASVRAARRR